MVVLLMTEPPKCPICSAEMKLLCANLGTLFWGCSKFPACKGRADYKTGSKDSSEELSDDKTESLREALTQMPVAWSDRVNRQGWIAEYTTIGALPGFAQKDLNTNDDALTRTLSQTLYLTRRNRDRSLDENSRLIGSLVAKILQRGRTPLPTLGVEKSALEGNQLIDWIVEPTESDPDVGYELAGSFRGKVSRRTTIQLMANRMPFRLDDEFNIGVDLEIPLFDSEYEEQFLTEWIPSQFGPSAPNWFLPQISLDRILEAYGKSDTGARRVDFLFVYPDARPLVIELDGPEHDDSKAIDRERDDLLTACGICVIRIPNSELDSGSGPRLDEVRQHCSTYFVPTAPLSAAEKNLAQVMVDCTWGAKLQLAIGKAVQYGWLQAGRNWHITIHGQSTVGCAATIDAITLIASLDQLYGTSTAPDYFQVELETGIHNFERSHNGEIAEVDHFPMDESSTVNIVAAIEQGPFQVVIGESDPNPPDIVIRPAYLPIGLAVESVYTTKRPLVHIGDRSHAIRALEVFLRHIFRKRLFRPLQAEAALNPLSSNDSIALLPTGAGKSIIYQLAGLLMPGVTLVVDPLISLIEDQVEGLLQYGIDRAAAVTSAMNTPEERARLLKGIERGEYQFILHSPERLQNPTFRTTLRSLAQISVINLAVIDEAHCVSEWGHDFRPAYLNVGRNIREFAKDTDGRPPPIIGLTGTASRSVLRDVLTELGIDKDKSDALIRPDSFNRKELKFDIRKAERVEDAKAIFTGILNGLPDKFGMPKQEFYSPAGKNTASGIVFVPFVNGKSHGVVSSLDSVRSATRANVKNYSGRAPRGQESGWEKTKRDNVRQFKGNQAPVLVSTKAFGMGIDKPNIRYTIHYGMPGSLEGFYQEAGRAGRDRRDAHCIVVFTEFDSDRTDYLLDPSLSSSEIRERNEERGKDRSQDDDITRALYFHLNSFRGQSEELEQVDEVLSNFTDLSRADTLELPFVVKKNDANDQEKALFRLVKIGVFEDYEKMYGSRKFKIYIKPFDLEKCKDNLLSYVQSAQPGRVKVFARDLEVIEEGNPKQNARDLASLLIDFTYDVIERSRRRAISESILLARNARSDKEIRRRLLDYLQEGVGFENFELLLEETNVAFEPWREIFEKISAPLDAGEIRGLAIRNLESFPDHPGLLLTRAVSEMMCSDANDVASSQALHAAFKGAVERYAIDVEDIEATMTWIGDMAAAKAPGLGLPFAVAFFEADKERVLPKQILDRAENVLRTLKDERVQTVFESFEMINTSEHLTDGVKPVFDVFEDPQFKQHIGLLS